MILGVLSALLNHIHLPRNFALDAQEPKLEYKVIDDDDVPVKRTVDVQEREANEETKIGPHRSRVSNAHTQSLFNLEIRSFRSVFFLWRIYLVSTRYEYDRLICLGYTIRFFVSFVDSISSLVVVFRIAQVVPIYFESNESENDGEPATTTTP